MNWFDPYLNEAISLFQQKLTVDIEDEEITDETKQAKKICRGIGDQVLRPLDASGPTEQQKSLPKNLWIFFESQLRVNINFGTSPQAGPIATQRVLTYLPNPSARAGYDTRSIFKRSLTGLKSDFFS